MTKNKKKVDVNSEEHKQQQHERELRDLESKMSFISEPTYTFEIGESVVVGNLKDVVIHDILHDGKIVEIDYTHVNHNYGNPIYTYNQKMYQAWMDVNRANNNDYSLINNDDIRLSYFQAHLQSLLHKAYHFGINFDPEYQREYVWELNDKIKLIDSIFNNVDIGKFAFIHNSDRKWTKTGYSYEILDGKQRLRAILDFYEGRFSYKGFYFNDLSKRDQSFFTSYSANIAEVQEIGQEQTIRYFLMLNTGGRMMSEEHLNKVREMLMKD